MKNITPTLPIGTRDFGPKEVYRRNFILEIMKETFHKFGFVPIQTPSFEKLEILNNNYGEEGNKLIYKILNSGDFLKKTNDKDFNNYIDLTRKISNKALRYDLTIPFSRYFAMNKDKLHLPFKRYQIQPVWRADRPQKGRYREFYQCDVDTIGSKSILLEAELITIACNILDKLKISNYKIKINHRGILKSIAKYIDEEKNELNISIAIDKIDKIGVDKALEELLSKNITKYKISLLKEILTLKESNLNLLTLLKEKFENIKNADAYIFELKELLNYLKNFDININNIDIEPKIARGLAYYTGVIFEIIIEDSNYGSIGGGGRYDNLSEIFGQKGLSGVGFSFGLDRVYNIMEDNKLLPNINNNITQILIINFVETQDLILKLSTKIRSLNINTEIFPSPIQLKKQLNYANKKNIPYVVILGEEEKKKNMYILKNMNDSIQKLLPLNKIKDLIDQIH